MPFPLVEILAGRNALADQIILHRFEPGIVIVSD
jgi:hypothetical protein